MINLINELEEYIDNEDKCIKKLERIYAEPYVTVNPIGWDKHFDRIHRRILLIKEVDTLKKLSVCTCKNNIFTKISRAFNSPINGYEEVRRNLYKCNKCNGHFSKKV